MLEKGEAAGWVGLLCLQVLGGARDVGVVPREQEQVLRTELCSQESRLKMGMEWAEGYQGTRVSKGPLTLHKEERGHI